jgi:hypothetical protein
MVKLYDAVVRNGPTKSGPGSTAWSRSVSATPATATGSSTASSESAGTAADPTTP